MNNFSEVVDYSNLDGFQIVEDYGDFEEDDFSYESNFKEPEELIVEDDEFIFKNNSEINKKKTKVFSYDYDRKPKIPNNKKYKTKSLKQLYPNNYGEIFSVSDENLDRINRNILVYQLHLTYDDSLTLDEIASILGLTKERIRQIEHSALKKLKHPSFFRRFAKYFDIRDPMEYDGVSPRKERLNYSYSVLPEKQIIEYRNAVFNDYFGEIDNWDDWF